MEARPAAHRVNKGLSHPSIARLVMVAKRPAAGVKPPYIQDWKAAASEPVSYMLANENLLYSSQTHQR